MKRYKVIEVNNDGKIELMKKELENMLNEAYNDGYSDGYSASTPYKDYTNVAWGNGTTTPSPILTCKDYTSTNGESTGKTCTITNSGSCDGIDGQTTLNGYFK